MKAFTAAQKLYGKSASYSPSKVNEMQHVCNSCGDAPTCPDAKEAEERNMSIADCGDHTDNKP